MNGRRESGILLHPTSLPGPYGLGELGPEAHHFARVLREMGQSLWQILPLGPTGYADSPYQSLSTFAGNPMWISLDRLAQDGLLPAEALRAFPPLPEDRVDYGAAIEARRPLLRAAARRFAGLAPAGLRRGYEAFCCHHRDWLDDFALFAALKDAHALRPWTIWPAELARRDPEALDRARRELAAEIEEARVLQFLFDQQWTALRRTAHAQGLRLVGDLPIFVAHDSADVWAHPWLFSVDERGEPTFIAGVPPDYFSATGQRWGNPLYRWDRHAESGFAWWIARMRRTLDLVDVVRLDHFRGFEAYWEIPASEPTAVNGRWVPAPGGELLSALRRALGELPIVAEDLGVITPPVEALRDRHRLPGMRILQFEVDALKAKGRAHVSRCRRNLVLYTGTHDNDTLAGWLTSPPGAADTRAPGAVEAERAWLAEFMRVERGALPWALVEFALASAAETAVLPLQDVLGLGSEARMNVPGTTSGNWQWRFRWEQLPPRLRRRVRALVRRTRRLPRRP